jgi:hypothetical protein
MFMPTAVPTSGILPKIHSRPLPLVVCLLIQPAIIFFRGRLEGIDLASSDVLAKHWKL